LDLEVRPGYRPWLLAPYQYPHRRSKSIIHFDQGYASWNGFTPDELDQRLAERRQIIALTDEDMHLYLAEMKRWASARVKKFREAGWCKAQFS
jgi:hypothetical protein